MAGHSHWAGIKHKKAIVDAKRGKIFSKMAKLIMQAAKNGVDLEYNVRLRHAVEKAKSYNMPNDKIENAIKKGSGQLEGYTLEEVAYEGYGPGGVAIVVEVLTDNRNRTTPEIRHIFEKRNGNLSGTGSVSWKFAAKGMILVSGLEMDEDEFVELLIDAGMEDYSGEGGDYEVIVPVEAFEDVKKTLIAREVEFKAELTKIPSATLALDLQGYQKILPLMEDLEDHDDVQEVYADFDVPDEVINAVDEG
ncbi:YebC/PmpR family DNA-binding transcriptional regulator [Planctomycetota bacterium]